MKTIIVIENGKITVEVDDHQKEKAEIGVPAPTPPIKRPTTDSSFKSLYDAIIPPPEKYAGKTIEVPFTEADGTKTVKKVPVQKPVRIVDTVPSTKERECIICGDDITGTHPNRKLCGKEDCRLEQQRRAQRKQYNIDHGKVKDEELQRNCQECGDDISHLRRNRKMCLKPECKEKSVQRAKDKYYQRVNGTPADMERRRIASRTYKAKHRDPNTPTRAKRVTPVTPQFLPGYEKTPEEIEAWRPKPSFPDSIPSGSIRETPKGDGTFNDPWDCAVCRNAGSLCALHESMDSEGKMPGIRRA